MVKTWPFRKVAVSDLQLGDQKAMAVFSPERGGCFRPNLLHFRKVKDLSLAEQLYLYERTRRFKDPRFDKQQKTAVGVFFSTGKNTWKNT